MKVVPGNILKGLQGVDKDKQVDARKTTVKRATGESSSRSDVTTDLGSLKAIEKGVESAKSHPDVRMELVEKAMRMMEAGDFSPDTDAIAKALIDESI